MISKKQIALIESKRDEFGLFSETDLIDLKKEEQVYILSEMIGLDEKQIKLLSKEKKRVDKILSLQKEKLSKSVTPEEKPTEVNPENNGSESAEDDMIPIEEQDESKPELKPGESLEEEKETTTEVYSKEAKPSSGVACPRCQAEMIHTGAGASGKDYKCPKCKAGLTIGR